MSPEYIAAVINSTLRMTTPILFAALGSAVCSRIGVFNIALEGQMLIASFFAVVANYFTGSPFISVVAGVASAMVISLVVGILQVKYKAADMVVGTAINLFTGGLTSFLLFVIFGIKGTLNDPKLVPMERFNLPLINKIPFVGTIFDSLTFLDYFAYIMAILIFIYLFKTVAGFRALSVGINKEATESLGTKAERIQIGMVVFSGFLCGLGGVVLSIGQVTLFTENMTSGRGFMAMAAASLGMSHPLGCIAASLFFGFAQAFGNVLQTTGVKSQLTMMVPYVATIIALVIFAVKEKMKKKAH